MSGYLYVGGGIGIILWLCKYLLTIAVLPKRTRKWLHNNPIGLIILDSGFGFLAMKTVTAAGATGLTTLIVLVAYGACTGILVLKYLIKRKVKSTWESWAPI
jgi:hypothetical protein